MPQRANAKAPEAFSRRRKRRWDQDKNVSRETFLLLCQFLEMPQICRRNNYNCSIVALLPACINSGCSRTGQKMFHVKHLKYCGELNLQPYFDVCFVTAVPRGSFEGVPAFLGYFPEVCFSFVT